MEPGYVKIIHPETLGVAEVPAESLAHHYRAGWRRLTEAEEAELDQPAPEEPAPMTRAQAAKAAKAAANAESKE